MTYQEAVAYLFTRLPMFQRVGAAAYKADLSNTIALCEGLGHPERQFKSIHVAGTNGKGSVSSTLASIFAESGYKTGLFTSPHLKDFRERIRINGRLIEPEAVAAFTDNFKRGFSHIKPSFFELTCAMAFRYFADEKVDIAILETGMGGRLDSTNVVVPEVAVITSISMDHQQFLGNTIQKIAAEKAGIIKPGVPVVVGQNPDAVLQVLLSKAAQVGAPAITVGPESPGIPTDLGGIYQLENMRAVRAAVEAMREKGWNLPENKVLAGAGLVIGNTGLRGRWEVLSTRPRTIADVGHNEDAVRMVVQMLQQEKYNHLHVVWGMVADKDATAILRQLPKDATYYWCRPDVPRGRDAHDLANAGATHGLYGSVHASVSAAIEAARRAATENDLILVAGSVFVVAEAL
jgi:dihydrofolate synthase/folylpolyglutamate synthase